MNETIFFTITGTHHYHGQSFFEPGQRVILVKDPENKHDTEAIKVRMAALGQVGWVANSVGTVVGECYSAGRLYDKIGDAAYGEVLCIVQKGVVCVLQDRNVGM